MEEPDGSVMPFSRGVVSRSLMAIGLGPEMGYRLANTLENRLWRSYDWQGRQIWGLTGNVLHEFLTVLEQAAPETVSR